MSRVLSLAAASWGIAATAATAAAGASTTAANVSLAASPAAQPVSSQDRMFIDQAHATTTTAKNLGGKYARDPNATFRKEQSAGSNPAVKTYAARYLPMLQTHLRRAEHAESVLHVPATR